MKAVTIRGIEPEVAEKLKTKAAGTPIPTNDIWIAASAFQHGYTVFSYDAHFELVPGLVKFPG